MVYTTLYESPLGLITLASEGTNLVGLWFENQKFYGLGLLSEAQHQSELKIFEETRKWLDRYFAGEKPRSNELLLEPIGSPFQKRVWSILEEIPYGTTITYGEVAKIISAETGKHMSAQAVGGSVGRNPVSIIIPCHRVIGANGSLTGYAGGIERKLELLKLEGANVNTFE